MWKCINFKYNTELCRLHTYFTVSFSWWSIKLIKILSIINILHRCHFDSYHWTEPCLGCYHINSSICVVHFDWWTVFSSLHWRHTTVLYICGLGELAVAVLVQIFSEITLILLWWCALLFRNAHCCKRLLSRPCNCAIRYFSSIEHFFCTVSIMFI